MQDRRDDCMRRLTLNGAGCRRSTVLSCLLDDMGRALDCSTQREVAELCDLWLQREGAKT